LKIITILDLKNYIITQNLFYYYLFLFNGIIAFYLIFDYLNIDQK